MVLLGTRKRLHNFRIGRIGDRRGRADLARQVAWLRSNQSASLIDCRTAVQHQPSRSVRPLAECSLGQDSALMFSCRPWVLEVLILTGAKHRRRLIRSMRHESPKFCPNVVSGSSRPSFV